MRFPATAIAIALVVVAVCPPVDAQEMRTGEAQNPRREDPLGFGSLSKNRPKGSTTEITAQKEATFDERPTKLFSPVKSASRTRRSCSVATRPRCTWSKNEMPSTTPSRRATL